MHNWSRSARLRSSSRSCPRCSRPVRPPPPRGMGWCAWGSRWSARASYRWRSSRLRPLHEMRDAMVDVIDGKTDPSALTPPPIADLNQLNDAIARVVARLRQAQSDHEASKRTLAHRTRTVDRLLDFSQTIQGAGKA